MRSDTQHPGEAELERTAKAMHKLLLAHPGHVPTNQELAQELGVHPDIAEQWKLWLILGELELEAEERGMTFLPERLKTND